MQNRLSGRRVLLADDNVVSRELVSLFLTEQGYEVEVARDGSEAVALATDHPFDLVILDLRMPSLDGYEAANQIRRHDASEGRQTPLVALTADNSPEAAQKVRDAGFSGLLIKPVSNVEFFTVVERALEGRKKMLP